jgi:DNA polymerase-1
MNSRWTMEIEGKKIYTDPREIAYRLRDDVVIGFDLETTGLSPWRSQIAIMQFYGHKSDTVGVVQCKDGRVPQPIQDLFIPEKLFVAHNAVSFDILFLAVAGVPWGNARWYDTLIGEAVVIGTGRKDLSISLASALKRRLKIEIDKSIDHAGWARDVLTEDQLQYAVSDVLYLPQLMATQTALARDTGQLDALKMEQRLVPIFAQMTFNGLPVNQAVLDNFLEDQQNEIDRLKPSIVEWYGDINMNSPKQIKEALASHGIRIPNTAYETLVNYVRDGKKGAEHVERLLEYRKPNQRIKMYGGNWKHKHIYDGWAHPRFKQLGTDTGRISSSNPNFQQIPRDSRYIIGNQPGYKIVSCDYSQIEIRMAAYIANDPALKAAVESEDVHRAIASEIYSIPPEQVSSTQRKNSKAVVFTMLFAGGPGAIYAYARKTGSDMTMDDAQQLYVDFLDRFEGLSKQRAWAADVSSRSVVFIRLLNGLRRGLVGDSRRPPVVINTLVQGNAAVGLKLGMLEAAESGLIKYLGATVHDELVAAVPEQEAVEYVHALSESMIRGMNKILPLPVSTDKFVGYNWGSENEIDQ